MKNGTTWYDTKGNVLDAHGGCVIAVGGFYYWYGENRRAQNYVSCYRSKDLKNWEFRNHILTMKSEIAPVDYADTAMLKRGFLNKKVNIERPKVLYCEMTGKYVLWAHYENGKNYDVASACIASSDTPDGEFVFHGEFRPMGNMSRDCTLYREDGNAYFISAANDNKDLKLYALTDDYLNVRQEIATLWPGESREAPTLFKRDGIYYMLTSACTGWTPNQGKYAMSEHLASGWSELRDFGNKNTYFSQPTWALECGGKVLYIGDRWGGGGKRYFKSTYVFLELQFQNGGLSIADSGDAFFPDVPEIRM